MAEMLYNVYDLLYPSPPTLQELSAITIVFHLHRGELKKRRMDESVDKFVSHLVKDSSLRNIMPNLPSEIYDITEIFNERFASSILQWRYDHFNGAFSFHRSSSYTTFADFDDLVYHFDGTVHYYRTAKKMMQCDRFSNEEKFKIACMYCFEKDIRRLWPSVSENITTDGINFYLCSTLFYWICELEDELHKIPNPSNQPIDDVMLGNMREFDRTSLEYFWNRQNCENRLNAAVTLSRNSPEMFARFILPKLNEHELDKFLAENDNDLMARLLPYGPENKMHVMPTWMYIRNKMSESGFGNLIEEIFQIETDHHHGRNSIEHVLPAFREYFKSTESETNLCCEVWKSAPNNLKRSAIQNNLTKNWLFERSSVRPMKPREVRFLLTVLQDATLEERKAFLHNTWQNLITDTPIIDLDKIIKLCFENENEIKLFKENTMSNYDNIVPYCFEILREGFFKKLDAFLNFVCDDAQTKRNWKQRLLQACFLREGNNLRLIHLIRAESMNKFIEHAYADANLGADFKNQLVSKFSTENTAFYFGLDSSHSISFHPAMNFVNTFVSTEQVAKQLKQRFVDLLKKCLTTSNLGWFQADMLQEFLVWCLGSDDGVMKFKQSISADEVFQNMVQEAEAKSSIRNEYDVLKYPVNLDEFLKWYFVSSEKIEEFKMKFSHIFKTFAPK